VIGDARRGFQGTLPHSDVCIVGGGPAGISLALRLETAGLSVLLVESGGHHESERSRDLNRGTADPPGSHEPLEENRRRQWGGTSAAWGGRCIPFDDLDFQERDWVPLSGWPFDRSMLDSYLVDAIALCEAGPASFDARTALPDAPEFLPGLDGDGILTHPIERWSPPTHFGKRYEKRLAASRSTRVLLNATCTHVQLTPSGESVEHIVIAEPGGRSLRVQAANYVLATGGLENARLLLSSDDVAPEGIGNHAGCLGRYYQTHLFGSHAKLVLNPDSPKPHVGFDRDAGGVYCRRRIWISPERQASERLLNTVFFPVRPPSGESGHRSALFSAVYLVKTFEAVIRRPSHAGQLLRSEREAIGGHWRAFVTGFPSAVPELYRTVVGRYVGSRRLPAVLPGDGLDSYHLQFQAEQVPNAEARVTLSEERDSLGMRRLVVAARATAQDIDSVVESHRVLDERLRRSGLGRLEYDEDSLRAALRHSTSQVNSGAHHLGTTRMSDDPGRGVVDAACRVHEVGNLYAVGGSVFPTSSHANPTLTIIALALRLGDHLAGLHASDDEVR
jgi:choline dehydrogenase-like flavoprotein